MLPRATRVLVLALATGFVVDAGGAVLCARWAPRRGRAAPLAGFKPEPPLDGIRFDPLPRGYLHIAMVEHGPGFEYYAVLAIYERKRQTTAQFGNGMRLEAGLPRRSWLAVRDAHRIVNAPPDYRAWFWGGGPGGPATGALTRVRPIWPGLAVNVAIYAGVAASLLLGPGAVRAFVRRRRRSAGLCVRCRYPLAGLWRCPECGTDQPP